MQIGLQSEYANLSVCGEISCYMKFINGKKDESFIQNSSWFSVRTEKQNIT